MLRSVLLSILLASGAALAQNPKQPPLPPSQVPPRSTPETVPAKAASITPERTDGSSSSKDDGDDLRPPADDAKTHPNSAEAVKDAEDQAGLYEGDEIGGVQEFKPWNPHKAEKDLEVGDFYFKRKNYRAALDRYREALYYKDNDAAATFKLAVCEEKLGDAEEARIAYDKYLKILPEGPFAQEAHRGLERLKAQSSPGPWSNNPAPKLDPARSGEPK